MHTMTAPLPSDTPLRSLPMPALEAMEDGLGRRGLIFDDGRVAAMGGPLLDLLGFDQNANLSGLHFSRLWKHEDRGRAIAALKEARTVGRAELTVDMGYIDGARGPARVILSPAPAGGLLLVRVRRAD